MGKPSRCRCVVKVTTRRGCIRRVVPFGRWPRHRTRGQPAVSADREEKAALPPRGDQPRPLREREEKGKAGLRHRGATAPRQPRRGGTRFALSEGGGRAAKATRRRVAPQHLPSRNAEKVGKITRRQ